jgi:hypothetical protein
MRYSPWAAAFAVAVLVSSTVSVAVPAAAVRAETVWDLDSYRPGPGDNVVLKWNEELLKTVRANPTRTGPTVTSRALGVLHTATFDAWAAYDATAKATRLGGSLRRPAVERTLANKNKAISIAAYRTLLDLFPNDRFGRKSSYDALMAQLGYDINDTRLRRILLDVHADRA